MQDQESYRQILGNEAPWHVERVEPKLSQAGVHVYREHEDKGERACAEGGAPSPHYPARITMIKPGGNGGMWTPVSTVMLRLRVGSAASLGCGW